MIRNSGGTGTTPMGVATGVAVRLLGSARVGSLFWPLAGILFLAVEIAAGLSGGDASWDLRNYHFYGPFALLHKPFGVDLAPAHMQTFFAPTMDFVPYLLARAIAWSPAVNVLLGLPQAIAVVLAFTLSSRLLRPQTPLEQLAVAMVVAIGATGAAGGTTIATTMSEMLPASLFLLALLAIVPEDLKSTPTHARLLAAGVLVGCACGLKLTMSYATLALALSLVCIPRRAVVELVSRPAVFGVGVALGAVAISGYWWLHQWMHYGNPLFPIMNDFFRSPQALPDSFVDRAFLPRSMGEAFAAPWTWALHLSWATGESRLRDPRFSLAMLAAVFCLVKLSSEAWRRNARPMLTWPALLLTTLFIVGFALWRLEFSIFRYLATLELLSGTMMALAIMPIARQRLTPEAMAGLWAALLVGCVAVTVYPQTARTPPGSPTIAADLGPLPGDSMVLLLGNEPMAYLAAFADPSVRFVATSDVFTTLDPSNPMQRQAEAAIAGHTGPLWGLESPEQQELRDQALQRYGLARGPCRPIQSNVSPFVIRLCRLDRNEVDRWSQRGAAAQKS